VGWTWRSAIWGVREVCWGFFGGRARVVDLRRVCAMEFRVRNCAIVIAFFPGC
jgi:hypothetical protein